MRHKISYTINMQRLLSFFVGSPRQCVYHFAPNLWKSEVMLIRKAVNVRRSIKSLFPRPYQWLERWPGRSPWIFRNSLFFRTQCVEFGYFSPFLSQLKCSCEMFSLSKYILLEQRCPGRILSIFCISLFLRMCQIDYF